MFITLAVGENIIFQDIFKNNCYGIPRGISDLFMESVNDSYEYLEHANLYAYDLFVCIFKSR